MTNDPANEGVSLAQAFFDLGVDAMNRGALDEAIEAFTAGAGAAPAMDGCWINWAAVLFDLGRYQEAIEILECGIRVAPHSVNLHLSLIKTYKNRKEHAASNHALYHALSIHPNEPQFLYLVAQLQDEPDREKSLRELTLRTPNFAPAWRSYAYSLKKRGAVEELIHLVESMSTQDPWVLNALGLAFREIGALLEAVEVFDAALEIDRQAEIETNGLLCACYPSELSQADVSGRHRAWGDAHGARAERPPLRAPSGKMRVGYLSSDFRTHSVAYFFEPLLKSHDRERFELSLLDLNPDPSDPIALRLRGYGDRWVDLSGLDDVALVGRLKNLQLDLIVELNGHTAGGRLRALSHRPAPLLATAIGYPYSTGLEAFDLRLTDEVADPHGEERFYRESLARISGGFLCYHPPENSPVPSSARSDSPFTFGSFNQLSKISSETVELWSSILLRAPEARLLLKSRQLSNQSVAEVWRSRFAQQGIDPSRLILMGRIPDKSGHLKLYDEIDLALDPTPYNGTTTTAEALWMGTPVLALRGDRHSARVAASILTHSGLADWITDSREEYISRAVDLAMGKTTLPDPYLVRAQMQCSSLMDSQRYTDSVEASFLQLWVSTWSALKESVTLAFILLIFSTHLSLSRTAHADKGAADPRASLGQRVLTATERKGEITIDGQLDEEAWGEGKESVGFIERSPEPGATPPVESSVIVLFDDKALYFGIRMAYDKAKPPVAWELRRDVSSLWSDDAITIKIDSRKDRRTTLGFAVNAAGATLDFIALDNGRSFLTEYDTLWEGAAHIGESAWFAELRIPYTSLAFASDGTPPRPGIAISRDHPARQATDDWTLLPPEFGPASALHYGTLEGLKETDGGTPLTLMPYLSARELDAPKAIGELSSSDQFGLRIGGDLRLGLGEGTWIEMSALTDFAQVDLDDALLNLDRFPLFYPERRAFFLNGADVFSFGVFGASQPFFTRRIGLTDAGVEVPIYGGAKLYSRAGKLRYGVLSSLTGLGEDQGTGSSSVSRMRYEVADGFVGCILTHTQDFETENSSLWETGYGLDMSQRLLSQKLEVSAAYSGMINETQLKSTPPQSTNVNLNWRGEDYQATLSALYVDEDYAPRLGFVRRAGMTQLSSSLIRVFYKPLGFNRFSLGPSVDSSWDTQFDQWLDSSSYMNAMIIGESGWSAGIMGGYQSRVVLNGGFELAGTQIQEGRYHGPSAIFFVSSPSAGAWVRAGLDYFYDAAFFGGQSQTVSSRVDLSLSRYLRLKGNHTYSWFSLGVGSAAPEATEQAWNLAAALTPNTTLQVDLVGQLNTQTSQAVGLARLRWRWAAGSDLFLVYKTKQNTQVTQFTQTGAGQETSQTEHQLLFKVVWRGDWLL